jgi:hypothetical protein
MTCNGNGEPIIRGASMIDGDESTPRNATTGLAQPSKENASDCVLMAVSGSSTPPAISEADVSLAFRLGWHVAELYAAHLPKGEERKPVEQPEHLPGMSDLSKTERAELTCRLVHIDLKRLAPIAAQAGIDLPDADDISRALEGKPPVENAVRDSLFILHKELLSDLTTADFRLGKAYGLGRSIADTTLIPSERNAEAYKSEFLCFRIAGLCDSLDDLSSAFPPHTAPAVRDSLREWGKWIQAETHDGTTSSLQRRGMLLTQELRDQGRLWRALLSGEKHPEDLLHPDDYVRAAVCLVRRMSSLAQRFLWSWSWIVVPAALVLVGAIGAAFTFLNGDSRIASAIAALIAGMGLSWKGLGATLGKAIHRAEEPLWHAELSTAIGVAAREPLERVRRPRRRVGRGSRGQQDG